MHVFTSITANYLPKAAALAHSIKRAHPEADTIHPSCAHWATAHAIDEIERELGVNVMSSQQAILWKALRTAGVTTMVDTQRRFAL